MPHGIDTGLIDRIAPCARELVTSYSLQHLRYADVRIDVSEGKRASAENGSPKFASDDYGSSFGARVLVDAVGTDFQLYPIPNCGKGQPRQTKKLGNGGSTMRSLAILTGGHE